MDEIPDDIRKILESSEAPTLEDLQRMRAHIREHWRIASVPLFARWINVHKDTINALQPQLHAKENQ